MRTTVALLVFAVCVQVAQLSVVVACGYCPPVIRPPPTPKPPTPKPPAPKRPCPTPPSVTPPSPSKYCPVDALKLGACVDLLGGLVHISLGDQAVNQCCPLLKGLAELEAALCLCTTLRAKLLGLDVYLPIALELLVACEKNPPKGFTCPSS